MSAEERLQPMNIWAKPGDRVAFVFAENGYSSDVMRARTHLKFGHIYTVDRTSVGSCHTSVWLKEVPDAAFNSVQFIDVSADGSRALQEADRTHPQPMNDKTKESM